MTKRLTALTETQKARMAPFAQDFIRECLRTGPLTEAEWQAQEDGMRACYGYAGIPWPGNVVRVPSPIVGALAAPIADTLIRKLRRGAVGGVVGAAVGGAVDEAVRDAVDEAVRGAVRDAVDGAVGAAVGGAVDEAVRGAVDEAVRGAVRDAVGRLWTACLGGRLGGGWWWRGWDAWRAFFRDETDLELPGDLWERSRAHDSASTAGWWWPFRDFTIVCDLPAVIHLERVGPDGWGSHRLHCETGPAIAWPDGWGVHVWHGVRVPAWVIDRSKTATEILREPNAEIRRCAIEALGWPRFVDEARLTQVGATVDDPGNPGQVLKLFDLPERLFAEPVRLLICVNGTIERDGTRRSFGLTTPAEISDPIEAAAWTFGIPAAEYARLEVRR